MIKVLQVVSSMALGGTEAFIMNNYRLMNRNEISFDFLIFLEDDWPYLKEIKMMGGNIYFAFPPNVFNYKKFEKVFKKIAKTCGPYDAVHSHVNIQNSLVMKAAKKSGIKKRISHSHDTYGLGNHGFRFFVDMYKKNLLLKNSTHFLACSKIAGDYLYGSRFFSKHGKTIPNGIDVGRYLFNENARYNIRKLLNISENAVVVSNISRFEAKKNQLFIIQIFKEMLCFNNNLVLLLAGVDGGQKQDCINLAKDLQIDNSIIFLNQRNDVPDLLSASDIYLFPSLYEGLGISFLEAQASGCLCIASTGVSPESNMKCGNAHYLELSKGPKEWSNFIMEKWSRYTRIDALLIRDSFVKNCFEIKESNRVLADIYYEK